MTFPITQSQCLKLELLIWPKAQLYFSQQEIIPYLFKKVFHFSSFLKLVCFKSDDYITWCVFFTNQILLSL